jgi:hypothetical protein
MKDLARVKEMLLDDHKHISEQLLKAYRDLADKTARMLETAEQQKYFTDLGHLRMYTSSIEELQVRLNTCNEKLILINWVSAE